MLATVLVSAALLFVVCLQIFKKPPIGGVVRIAGLGPSGSSGDGGPALNATFNSPDGLAIGSDGSLYVADLGNNKIRKIDPLGVVTTVAGTGATGNSEDNGPATSATFKGPIGVAVSSIHSSGRRRSLLGTGDAPFIADSGNNRVRKVNPSGIVIAFGSRSAGCFETMLPPPPLRS